MRRIIHCFEPLILFLISIFFASAVPNICFASREDVVLSRDYQLESEKETLKDNFSWEINFVHGLSPVSRLLGLGSKRFGEKPPKEYLDALGLTYSSNDFLITAGANYLVTPRLEFSAGIPVSLVLAEVRRGPKRRSAGLKLKLGIGDIYGGVSYALLTESKLRPLVAATVDINSAFSKYTSMGDGFWGITPGFYLRKFICGPLYALGMAGYTNRLNRHGVTPGDITRYGAGIGFLSADKKIELSLEKTGTAATKIGNRTVMGSEEDLTMIAAFTTIFGSKTTTIGLFLAGLEEGIDWGRNSAGVFMGVTF